MGIIPGVDERIVGHDVELYMETAEPKIGFDRLGQPLYIALTVQGRKLKVEGFSAGNAVTVELAYRAEACRKVAGRLR